MTASEVQHASNSITTTGSLTVTFGANVTPGNNVIVAVGTFLSTTAPTVSGVTLGGTALTKANSLASGKTNCELWYLENAPSGQNTITISLTGGSGSLPKTLGVAAEWQGLAASASLDAHPAGGGGTGASWSSNSSGTLAHSAEVVFGAAMLNMAGGTPTLPSTPWTNETATANSGLQEVALGYQIVSSTSALTYNGTTSTSANWTSCIVSFVQNTASPVSGSGSLALGALAMSGAGSETFSGTGSLALGPLAFHGSGTQISGVAGSGSLALGALRFAGSGSLKISGSGSLRLGPIGFSGTNYLTGSGGIRLAAFAFHGAGALKISGTGSFALGPLAFHGVSTSVAVPPIVPVEPAGVIATATDMNKWATACRFHLGSSSLTRPVFIFMASAAQALTTSFAAVTYSATGAIFKDNNGGWSAANPSRYTVQTAGYYHVGWSVSAASGAGNLEAYAQVTTSAANPYNPSTTLQFQHSNRAATTALVATSSGGLVPIYLVPGDYIEVYAKVGTAVSTSTAAFPQFSGEWVST